MTVDNSLHARWQKYQEEIAHLWDALQKLEEDWWQEEAEYREVKRKILSAIDEVRKRIREVACDQM